MERCYEYLGCDKQDCVMYDRKDNTNCWEVEGTLCNHQGIQMTRDKLGAKTEESCARAGCIYYKIMKDRTL